MEAYHSDIHIALNPIVMCWRPAGDATERLEGANTAQDLHDKARTGGQSVKAPAHKDTSKLRLHWMHMHQEGWQAEHLLHVGVYCRLQSLQRGTKPHAGHTELHIYLHQHFQ